MLNLYLEIGRYRDITSDNRKNCKKYKNRKNNLFFDLETDVFYGKTIFLLK